jgi:leucyl aminopeptidase (aminopeptidase T)
MILEQIKTKDESLFDNLERRAETLTARAFTTLHIYGETLNLLIDLSGHEWFPGIPEIKMPKLEELWTLGTVGGLNGWLTAPNLFWVDGQQQRYERLRFDRGCVAETYVTEALAVHPKTFSHSLVQGIDLSRLPLVISLVQRHHQEGVIRSHLVIGEYLGLCDVVIELGHPNVDGILSDGSRQPVMREGVWWFATDTVAEGAD